jgi:hypothetical protein
MNFAFIVFFGSFIFALVLRSEPKRITEAKPAPATEV